MKKIVTMLMVLSVGTTVMATDIETTALIAAAKTGTYLFVGVGSAKSDDFSNYDYDPYGYGVDTSTNAMFRLGVGYAKALNNNVSVGGELAYNNYGSDEGSGSYQGGSFSNSYSAIDLLARGNYYFGSAFRVYAKAGIAQERAKATFDYYGDDSSSTTIVPEFGLGVGYMMGDSFAADLGYYIITGDDSDENAPQISGAVLAFSYYL